MSVLPLYIGIPMPLMAAAGPLSLIKPDSESISNSDRYLQSVFEEQSTQLNQFAQEVRPTYASYFTYRAQLAKVMTSPAYLALPLLCAGLVFIGATAAFNSVLASVLFAVATGIAMVHVFARAGQGGLEYAGRGKVLSAPVTNERIMGATRTEIRMRGRLGDIAALRCLYQSEPLRAPYANDIPVQFEPDSETHTLIIEKAATGEEGFMEFVLTVAKNHSEFLEVLYADSGKQLLRLLLSGGKRYWPQMESLVASKALEDEIFAEKVADVLSGLNLPPLELGPTRY